MEKPKLKVVMISSMQPYSNYSRSVAMGLAKQDIELIVYAEKAEKNKEISDCGQVRSLWERGFGFYTSVFKELLKDKPDVIHIQQEFNMYGGILISVLLPVFLGILNVFKAKKVVTMHAVVKKDLITKEFVKFFKGDDSKLPPFLLKTFFQYFYWSTAAMSDKVIVHTPLLKKNLVQGYYVEEDKIEVIPHIVIIKFDQIAKSLGDYFFYFGYLVRRKGLKNVIDGFIKFLKESGDQKYKLLLGGGVIKGQEFARDEILNLIEKSNTQDKIEYLGFMEQKDMDLYFSQSYACVVPGEITIAASGPLSHVFSYGKCVLVSNVGHLAEEIIDGKEGFVADNDSWEKAFSKAAKRQDLVFEIEQNIEKKARNRNAEETAKKHIEVYK